MFESMKKAPADKIFALVAAYRADERPNKLDLGIGVYKDPQGKTPIMDAVKIAEQRLLDAETTKSYIGVSGNRAFCDAVSELVFDGGLPADRIASAQAPGGTGSLWVLLSVIARARPGGKLYLSDPTWPNHKPMTLGVGLVPETYPYFDPETGKVRFDEMLACLDGLGPQDTILLHGCCHNPTGANLTPDQWDKVAVSLKKTGAFALVDLAYLGFGQGLTEDAYGVRKLAAELPELMVAFSASKNFGIYRERAGVAFCIGANPDTTAIAASQMGNVIRAAYSQPPNHGAELVHMILTQPDLRASWETELADMRDRMVRLRKKLAEALRRQSNSDRFDFVAEHRGMFSLMGLSVEQVATLKDENAIYLIDDSRVNVAGLPEDDMDALAEAILAASAQSD